MKDTAANKFSVLDESVSVPSRSKKMCISEIPRRTP
jgi:hypothetical protein